MESTHNSLFSYPLATVDPNQLSPYVPAPQSNGKWKSLAMGLTTKLAIAAVLTTGAAATEFDTVHALDQSFAATKPQNLSWTNNEVKSWLDQTYGLTATTEMNKLHALIQQVFGNVKIISKIYSDPDESWSKVQIQIDSQLGENFDRQLALEDKLFAEIWKSTSLKELSQRLIISQV